MSEKAIVEKIIGDANLSAAEIIRDAEEKAKTRIAEAEMNALRHKKGAEAELAAKAKSIIDGKAASARLDGAKILLGEKRGVIDEIYARAYERLLKLSKEETLYLAGKLIEKYAEDGDEICFAENYSYAKDVSNLPVVKQKNLKVCGVAAKIDSGFMLSGKNADKNLSYSAILAEDREKHQAEISAEIFVSG